MDENIGPDERVFRADLDKGPFLSGADRGRWRLISVEWPVVIIAVSASERPDAPGEYAFRLDCAGYPQVGPTAQLWDAEQNGPLPPAKWPGGKFRVPAAFRTDWQGGTCLYLPCDRISINGHDNWRHQHPEMIWSPDKDITLYLRTIYDLLNSSDYTGLRSS
ncbi:MAG TPA: hypothetical protein VH186_03545 [Chloroflexia bacterium]|nr:hypothetical protein [Chloroflexia bacterium]